MEPIKERKKVYAVICLFMFTYMVSYITRINYGAIIVDMVRSTGYTKSALSMALTGSFITYGAGQIVSGLLGDKFRPKILIFCGLVLSVCMNTIIPFCRSPFLMLAVWCVNGFAQAFMWPPIVRLMTVLFDEDDFRKASVFVSWGSSFGTIVIYLVAPLIITYLSWKAVFWFSAACGALMAIVWMIFCKDVRPEPKKTDAQTTNIVAPAKLFTPVFIISMIAIVFQGALRDGVTTWMPTYISETYDLGSNVSILTGVVLPVFSILTFQAASVLYRRVIKNLMACACLFFGVGAVAALFLYFFSDSSVTASVVLSATLTGCMHGVNFLLICLLPGFYKGRKVSTVSGILNSCTYVGSAISTYGIALLSENVGWKFTLFIWFFIALGGAALCLINSFTWKRREKENV